MSSEMIKNFLLHSLNLEHSYRQKNNFQKDSLKLKYRFFIYFNFYYKILKNIQLIILV